MRSMCCMRSVRCMRCVRCVRSMREFKHIVNHMIVVVNHICQALRSHYNCTAKAPCALRLHFLHILQSTGAQGHGHGRGHGVSTLATYPKEQGARAGGCSKARPLMHLYFVSARIWMCMCSCMCVYAAYVPCLYFISFLFKLS
jgi:hypothetical protein